MSYTKALAHHTFSTKRFVPGHVLGAAIVALGTVGLAKLFLGRHADEIRERLQADLARAMPLTPIGNPRGTYGKSP